MFNLVRDNLTTLLYNFLSIETIFITNRTSYINGRLKTYSLDRIFLCCTRNEKLCFASTDSAVNKNV